VGNGRDIFPAELFRIDGCILDIIALEKITQGPPACCT